MPQKLPQRDPSGAYRRKVTAARRVGKNKHCACGEARPEALETKIKPVMCGACKRKSEGKTTMDDHHFAGKANNPTTIPVPVNDHRAELNVAQGAWPREVLENPDGCPVLAAAGSVIGFTDTVIYLIERGLHWVSEMLVVLSALLREELGAEWWVNTPLERFAPGR